MRKYSLANIAGLKDCFWPGISSVGPSSPNIMITKNPLIEGLILLCVAFLLAVFASPIMAAPPNIASIPQLFRQPQFTSATLAEAVNHYVSIGEDASIKELALLDTYKVESIHSSHPLYAVNERIDWVCRILFRPKGKKPLPIMPQGATLIGSSSMPKGKWPLFPVIVSGSSYFVIGEVDHFEGTVFPLLSYLSYYQSHGYFRKTLISVPTRAQAIHDFTMLHKSHVWRAIHWKKGYQIYFEKRICAYLKGQATRIPSR